MNTSKKTLVLGDSWSARDYKENTFEMWTDKFENTNLASAGNTFDYMFHLYVKHNENYDKILFLMPPWSKYYVNIERPLPNIDTKNMCQALDKMYVLSKDKRVWMMQGAGFLEMNKNEALIPNIYEKHEQSMMQHIMEYPDMRVHGWPILKLLGGTTMKHELRKAFPNGEWRIQNFIGPISDDIANTTGHEALETEHPNAMAHQFMYDYIMKYSNDEKEFL
jgi:hypothetical protein|tara:strand:- start:857 stop:1519 length:663 start_codon:yes stop_codon:yes gene_type:complete